MYNVETMENIDFSEFEDEVIEFDLLKDVYGINVEEDEEIDYKPVSFKDLAYELEGMDNPEPEEDDNNENDRPKYSDGYYKINNITELKANRVKSIIDIKEELKEPEISKIRSSFDKKLIFNNEVDSNVVVNVSEEKELIDTGKDTTKSELEEVKKEEEKEIKEEIKITDCVSSIFDVDKKDNQNEEEIKDIDKKENIASEVESIFDSKKKEPELKKLEEIAKEAKENIAKEAKKNEESVERKNNSDFDLSERQKRMMDIAKKAIETKNRNRINIDEDNTELNKTSQVNEDILEPVEKEETHKEICKSIVLNDELLNNTDNTILKFFMGLLDLIEDTVSSSSMKEIDKQAIIKSINELLEGKKIVSSIKEIISLIGKIKEIIENCAAITSKMIHNLISAMSILTKSNLSTTEADSIPGELYKLYAPALKAKNVDSAKFKSLIYRNMIKDYYIDDYTDVIELTRKANLDTSNPILNEMSDLFK